MARGGINIHHLGNLLWRLDRWIPANRSAGGLETCWPFKDLLHLADHVLIHRIRLADFPRTFDDMAFGCVPAFPLDTWKRRLGCRVYRLVADGPLLPATRHQIPAGPI